MSNEQIVINNLLISYLKSETAGPQCLLFLHGWRSNKEVWAGAIELISRSADKPISCYAIDLPGFGKSETPRKAMTVGNYAAVVAEFIEKLQLKNLVIVGHSFGGRVGIKLAASRPQVISKLVLVDSAGFVASSFKKTLMGIVAKILKPFFQPKFMQGLRQKIYQLIGAEDYLATPELQRTFLEVTAEDLSADMKKIICPTLIINGENDNDTPVKFGRRMQSLISNSKFVTLKNAGHFSFLDQSGEFVKNLTGFIL